MLKSHQATWKGIIVQSIMSLHSMQTSVLVYIQTVQLVLAGNSVAWIRGLTSAENKASVISDRQPAVISE